MSKAMDLTGKRFGRLTVIKRVENTKQNRVNWLCLCDCGKYSKASSDHLLSGHTQSCGCLRYERFRYTNTKHGQSHTRIYNIWASMKSRCYNKNNKKDYKDYGGRGITICDEWLNSFNNFYNWAISNGYEEGLTIDRIDVNGNYEPSNCKWSNVIEQANNRRNNHLIEYKGEAHTIAEWSRILGIEYPILLKRISYHKWDICRAFTQPIRGKEMLT